MSKLIIDSWGSIGDGMLSESYVSGDVTKFRGKFSHADMINKNKRIYPKSVLEQCRRNLQELIENRRFVGELDHPADSTVHLTNASHLVTKLWWEGDILMGEAEVLKTAEGLKLEAILNSNVKVGISSRGVGNGQTNEDGIMVIGEGFRLLAFDVVADPSTPEAFQSKISQKNESFNPFWKEELKQIQQIIKDKKNNLNNLDFSSVKNESNCIDKINKDLLIAYLSGMVSQKTDVIKSRLG